MEEESLRFWIIPIICMVAAMGVIFPFMINHQITIVHPNAAIEIDEIKKMTCEELKTRNALGSYWTSTNGEFARDKVQRCIDAEKEYKSQLSKIRQVGTHQEKIDAGFTKLWFGVYDHPDLSYRKVPSLIVLPNGLIENNDLYPSEIKVIIGYNNTIIFENKDQVGWFVTADYGEFGTPLLKPNDTASVTISDPGIYGYYSKPWTTGTLTVFENQQ